jgi:alpha-ribazole phosphatase
MSYLYLIRHGEPELTGIMLGQLDPPLSSAGRKQCEADLADLHVEVVWTSPLRRARETAAFIPAPLLREIGQLREIDQGLWTGKSWAEIESSWGQLAACKLNDWLGIPSPAGESWGTFLDRVTQAWDIIRSGPMPAAVVAHQGVNAALMHLIRGSDPIRFSQRYGEVIPID